MFLQYDYSLSLNSKPNCGAKQEAGTASSIELINEFKIIKQVLIKLLVLIYLVRTVV